MLRGILEHEGMPSRRSMHRGARTAELSDAEVMATVGTGRSYSLVFLRRGPIARPNAGPPLGHLRYQFGLFRDGPLRLIGPVTGGDDLIGTRVYDTTDAAAARRLVEADPDVAAGYVSYEVLAWFGLPGVLGAEAGHE